MADLDSKTLLNKLKNPFDPKFVKWRVGATSQDKKSGIALAYIDSREVMKRLDEVCGVGNWQDRLIAIDGGFICEIGIKIDGEWVWRSNAAGNTKVEPIKGGSSDALKRAASVWGVGRYLYYLPNIWVAIKPAGNSYVLAEQPELPSWAQPNADWEKDAESSVDASATADAQEAFEENIGLLDTLRSVRNVADLDLLVDSLDDKQKLLFSNEINIKRRELNHASNIEQ
jgi:hypothetical protein